MALNITGARATAAIKNMKVRPAAAFLQEAGAPVGTVEHDGWLWHGPRLHEELNEVVHLSVSQGHPKKHAYESDPHWVGHVDRHDVQPRVSCCWASPSKSFVPCTKSFAQRAPRVGSGFGMISSACGANSRGAQTASGASAFASLAVWSPVGG